MKKIIISNGWSDDNKGDSAIVEGLIDVIKRSGDRQFSIISSFSADSEVFEDSTRHLARKFPLGLFPHPVFRRCPVRRSGRLRRCVDIARALVLLAAPNIGVHCLDREQQKSVKEIQNADLVIGKGGHYLFGTSGLGGLFTLFSNGYTLLLANRLGVRTALSANSIGPFFGKPASALARFIFGRIDVIQLREPRSIEQLRALGIEGGRETFDTALAIEEEDIGDLLDGTPDYVVFTARQWDFPYDKTRSAEKFKKYIDSLVELARACSNLGLKVLIAPQVIGPTILEDDRIINRQLADSMKDVGVQAVVLDADFSPGQLKSIYARARFLVGTRFHSVILALSSGTPVIAISYHGPKAPGIMGQFDLGEYVLNIDDMEPAELLQMLHQLLGEEGELRNKIDIKRVSLERNIEMDVDALVLERGP